MGARRMISVHLTWCYRAALIYWIVGEMLWRQAYGTHCIVLGVLSHINADAPLTAHPSPWKPCTVCVSVLGSRQFCAWRECATCPFCDLKEAMMNTERVVETSRRRVLVEVRLENIGENAYNTQLHISHSANLHLSSLIVKVCFHTFMQSTLVMDC